MVYLVGDVGGTKIHLALFSEEDQTPLKEGTFSSPDFPDFSSVIRQFLKEESASITQACFGIAGPVRKGRCRLTNLPWIIEAKELQQTFSIQKVHLINDLQASAYSLNLLKKEDLFVLSEGKKGTEGNQAIISAGTGLGEAGIFYDGQKHHPFACEGGHVDFAPKNDLEDLLLVYLRKKFGHVSYERILSGLGLFQLYLFFVETKQEKETKERLQRVLSEQSPALVSALGLQEESKAAMRAIDLFLSIYGAEAGNLALKMYALGGVFLGGGIAPKLLSAFRENNFMKSFLDKGRMSPLLSSISVSIILNEKANLLGALSYIQEN